MTGGQLTFAAASEIRRLVAVITDLRTALERAKELLDDDGCHDIPDDMTGAELKGRGYVSVITRQGYINSENAWHIIEQALARIHEPSNEEG